jgi:hypothetical protein
MADDVIDRERARFESNITFTRNVNESLIVFANNSNFNVPEQVKYQCDLEIVF